MRTGDYILKQSKVMLENKQHAILCAAILALVPFAAWLSVSLMCLITLRKGAKAGFDVLLPAMVVHSIPLMMWLPLMSVVINALVAYLPCYFAAIILRKTCKWQAVFGVFLLLTAFAFVVVQWLAPNNMIEQFNQFKSMLSHYSEYQDLVANTIDGLDSPTLVNLFFGVQLFSVVISALISLMFARSIQSKLFMPNGFKLEISAFRGNKFSFAVLLAVMAGCYYEIPLGIFLVPFVLAYFLMAGFNLAYFMVARKWQFNVFALLLLIVLLKPTLVLFGYLLLGAIDGLINFRLYLPSKVKESI